MKTDSIYSVQSSINRQYIFRTVVFMKTDSIYSVQSYLKSKVTSFVGNVQGETLLIIPTSWGQNLCPQLVLCKYMHNMFNWLFFLDLSRQTQPTPRGLYKCSKCLTLIMFLKSVAILVWPSVISKCILQIQLALELACPINNTQSAINQDMTLLYQARSGKYTYCLKNLLYNCLALH